MDLAKLVVRLEAQSAQLLSELEKANGRIQKFERNVSLSLDKVNKKFTSFGFGVKASIGALLTGLSFQKLIDANAEAAKTFAQLENAVEKAGDAAGGRTAEGFRATAGELANVTTQAGGAIQNVQQLLLRFQNIRSDRFDEATERVLDLSQALGTDLDGAAKLVGRALSDPIKGMTALAKAGVVLSEGQQKVIKDLTESGRRAEAQGILLDELADKYGGAARAARGNFSGALTAVKNSLGDLMESDGGLPEATESLDALAKTLRDPAVKAGADALFSTLIRGAAAATQFLGETVAGLAILAGQGQDAAVNLDTEIINLAESIGSFKKQNPFPDAFGKKQLEEMTARLAALRIEYEKLQKLGEAGAMNARTGRNMTGTGAGGSGAFELPDIEVFGGMTEAQEKELEALRKAGDAMTRSVQTPLENLNATIAEADRLLSANVITLETWTRVVAEAADKVDPLLGQIARMSDEMVNLDEATEKALEELDAELAKQTDDLLDREMGAAIDTFEETAKKAAEQSTRIYDQMVRNTQDVLADGIVDILHDGFREGGKSALEAFGDMLEQMVAQALAADIVGKLFGDGEGGEGFLSGLFGGGSKGTSNINTGENDWLSKIGGLFSGGGGGWAELLGGLFGFMDHGGHGNAGEPVLIGRGAQPELFVPDTAGDFYPAAMLAGGGGVTQNIYLAERATERSVRQMELEASRRQRIAQTRLG